MVRAVVENESFHRMLGRDPHAASIAACQVADACAAWQLPCGMVSPAHAVAFDLVWMSRGPHDLHLRVSMHAKRGLLIEVSNYDGARVAVQTPLFAADRARLLADGADDCGQFVADGGLATWASLAIG